MTGVEEEVSGQKIVCRDLRDQESAEKAGQPPGRYLLVYGISGEQVEDRELIPKLYPRLVIAMFASAQSAEQFRGWEFIPVAHDAEQNILLLRAEEADSRG
ncbi:MAG: hypothetical protein HYS86_01255 [Candidatus Chisholmbacteria bacterium]|nr:hypothetical protein [Candidatus Chisholmbacteria bacterium]